MISADVTFIPDEGEIVRLNDPDGLVGRGVQRAGDVTAERVRKLIVGYGLVDSGAMLDAVTTRVVTSNADEVRLSVGTPGVEYTLYQREPFLLEALGQLSPSDFDQ